MNWPLLWSLLFVVSLVGAFVFYGRARYYRGYADGLNRARKILKGGE